jgi:hypothetical protein
MNVDIMGPLVAVVVGVFAAIVLFRRERELKFAFVNFGDKKTPMTKENSSVLFLEYVRQQRMAFGLLWFAVAVGIILAVTLVLQAIFGELNLGRSGTEALALTGDGGLAAGAFSVYRSASQRVERIARSQALISATVSKAEARK